MSLFLLRNFFFLPRSKGGSTPCLIALQSEADLGIAEVYVANEFKNNSKRFDFITFL